mmetsp:Transcript_24356/g.52520  ORF Transcript_24356/g.52520 Transcript_24356/m.52520 type:complete len:239 (-) Transcript_24356:523-1239(-)
MPKVSAMATISPPRNFDNHMVVRRMRYMSKAADATTSGLWILIATVLPPHLAASTFPIAASRTGLLRILALYTWPMDADATTRLSLSNSNMLSIGSDSTNRLSLVFLPILPLFCFELLDSTRLTFFILGKRSESSSLIIFIASMSGNDPTSSTSFPSSSAQILLFNKSGRRLNACPDLMRATLFDRTRSMRSSSPLFLSTLSLPSIFSILSVTRPKYQPSKGNPSIFSLSPISHGLRS